MKRRVDIEQLLRWRLALAEDESPLPPRALHLLHAIRPWWEVWPERLRARAARLSAMSLAYGYAMAGAERPAGHPVPVVVAGAEDAETYARVLYLSVRSGRMRLRFTLEDASLARHASFETTMVSTDDSRPIALAVAERSQTGEYRLDIELPATSDNDWASLRVTDPMPFRLILEPVDRAPSA